MQDNDWDEKDYNQYDSTYPSPYTQQRQHPIADTEEHEDAIIYKSPLHRVFKRMFNSGVEARGIERVPEDERDGTHTIGLLLLWWSVNSVVSTVPIGVSAVRYLSLVLRLTMDLFLSFLPSFLHYLTSMPLMSSVYSPARCITTPSLSLALPLAQLLAQGFFFLSFKSAMAAIVAFTAVGAACCGFIATLGPKTGLRTMVISRYSVGFAGGTIFAILNILTQLVNASLSILLQLRRPRLMSCGAGLLMYRRHPRRSDPDQCLKWETPARGVYRARRVVRFDPLLCRVQRCAAALPLPLCPLPASSLLSNGPQ